MKLRAPGVLRGFFCAVGFLTVIPVPRALAGEGPEDFRRVPVWMPAVGALIGLGASFAARAVHACASAGIAALVGVFALAALQGGLHLDGLADTFDGFLSCRPRERALEIMKDSRIGTFGTLALFFTLAAQLVAVLSMPPNICWAALVAAPTLGRCTMAPTMLMLKSARPGGMGEMCAGPCLALAAVVAAAVCALPFRLLPDAVAWTATLGSAVVYLFFVLWCGRRIGGYTGDTLGAGSELVETAFLLLVAAA